MEVTAKKAQQIVRNPTSQASPKRYKFNAKLYHDMLLQNGVDPNNPDFSSSRNKNSDPVSIACSLILQRCGPTNQGYEGLKASSTGGAIKSSVVSCWQTRGIDGDFVTLPDGSITGNPGKSQDLQVIIKRLDKAQRVARMNLTRRSYQQTHEDVLSLYFSYVKPQLCRTIRKDPTVDYLQLQTACINLMQFNSISRASEILNLKVTDLLFTGEYPDSPVVGVLPVIKNRRRSYTYFRFTKAVDVSVCGLSALLGWLCVLRAHDICNDNLFLQLRSNKLQGGTCLDGTTYARTLKSMGEEIGIDGLAEHSARRGGAGFQYFVPRRDLFFIYRAYSWESLPEMLKYIGIEDVNNSYALLGFTSFGTNELSFSVACLS